MKKVFSEKVFKIIFTDSVSIDRKVSDPIYSFREYDDFDFLYIPKTSTYKESIFQILGEITKNTVYSKIEIDFSNTLQVDYESVLEFFATYKNEEIFEIKIDNSFERKMNEQVKNLIEEFPNLDVFECESLSISQFETFKKIVPCVLSNGEAGEFSEISEFCHSENGVSGIGDGRMSLTNCLYFTNLRIDRTFDISKVQDTFEKYLNVAKNIEKIKFNFSKIGEQEKQFIFNVCKIIRNHKNHISKKLKVSIFSEKDNQLFSYREILNLEEIQKILCINNFDFSFDSNHLYVNKKLDEIKDASNIFNFQISLIQNKNFNFSPYEKFLMCYYFTKQHTFGENPQNVMESRNVVDLMNKKMGVCKSFSSLFSMFLNRCGIKHINDQVFLKSKTNDREELHLRTVFSMIDEKYGIDGIFVSNPTFDAENLIDGDKNFLFAHTLLGSKLKNLREYSATPLLQLVELDREQSEDLLSKPVYLRKFIKNLLDLGVINREDSMVSVIDGYGISDYHVPYNIDEIKNEKSSSSLAKRYIHDCLFAINRIKKKNPISTQVFACAMEKIMKVLYQNKNSSDLVESYVNHSEKEYKRVFEKGKNNTFSNESNEIHPFESQNE